MNEDDDEEDEYLQRALKGGKTFSCDFPLTKELLENSPEFSLNSINVKQAKSVKSILEEIEKKNPTITKEELKLTYEVES